MNDILKEDLKQFFPDVYIRTIAYNKLVDDSMDFGEHTLKEILSNSGFEGEIAGAFVYIYINKGVGTAQNYEAEYEYFTETIEQYCDENRMIPVTVIFYWIDEETKEMLKRFFNWIKILIVDSIMRF